MNDDFALVREVAADSMLWRGADHLLTSVKLSWRHSTFRQRGAALRGCVTSWATIDRVRVSATAVAIAGLVNVVLLSGANPYAAPGIPRTVVVLTAIFAVVVAIWPRAFMRAWTSSLPGRIGAILRRLIYKPAE